MCIMRYNINYQFFAKFVGILVYDVLFKTGGG